MYDDSTAVLISPQGSFVTIHNFKTLVDGGDGFFYGTTEYGGSNYASTIFKID